MLLDAFFMRLLYFSIGRTSLMAFAGRNSDCYDCYEKGIGKKFLHKIIYG